MKKLLLLLLACGMFASAFAQNDAEPITGIIARDLKNNIVVARNNTTGRLFCFKADNLDIKAVSKGDAVNVNWQTRKVTAISGAVRNYPVIQPDKAEPVGILIALRIDNAEPITDIVTPKINNAEPIAGIVTPKVNNAEPVGKPTMNTNSAAPVNGIVSIQVDNAEPISGIVTPKINNAEPVGKPRINNAEPPSIVTAKNRLTGKTFQFKVPAAIAKTLKVGDPAYAEPVNDMQINYSEPINDFAIVQSSYGNSNGQMASYGYPATSADETTGNANDAEKWVITPISTMKGVLGRLDINFPPDVERNILIYQTTDHEFIRSVSRNDKTYTIAPGEYRFTLTNVPVDNVPIQKGHETRLKAGFLDIVSEGHWDLYDEAKEKAYTSGNKPKKLPLPVGRYQIKLGGQFYPVVIKDGETVEY